MGQPNSPGGWCTHRGTGRRGEHEQGKEGIGHGPWSHCGNPWSHCGNPWSHSDKPPSHSDKPPEPHTSEGNPNWAARLTCVSTTTSVSAAIWSMSTLSPLLALMTRFLPRYSQSCSANVRSPSNHGSTSTRAPASVQAGSRGALTVLAESSAKGRLSTPLIRGVFLCFWWRGLGEVVALRALCMSVYWGHGDAPYTGIPPPPGMHAPHACMRHAADLNAPGSPPSCCTGLYSGT